MHNFHGTHEAFPAGYGFNQEGNYAAWRKAWGWGAHLLPYMDQPNLYRTLDVGRREFDEALPGNNSSSWPAEELAAIRTAVPAYLCPSDIAPTKINTSADFCHSGGPDSTKPAISNYAGVYGYNSSNWGPGTRQHGALVGQERQSAADFRDGMSQTFMVGERGWDHEAAYWVGVGNVNSEAPWSSPKAVGRTFMIKPNAPLTNRYYSGFSSYHDGGVQFLLADGSVHFVAETVDFDDGLSNGGVVNNGWSVGYNNLNKSTLGVYQRLGLHRRRPTDRRRVLIPRVPPAAFPRPFRPVRPPPR